MICVYIKYHYVSIKTQLETNWYFLSIYFFCPVLVHVVFLLDMFILILPNSQMTQSISTKYKQSGFSLPSIHSVAVSGSQKVK